MRLVLCDVDRAGNELCEADINAAPWVPYQMGTTVSFLPPDGAKRVRVQVKDGSERVSPAPPYSREATIKVDTQAPQDVAIRVGNGSGVVHASVVAVTIAAVGADLMRMGAVSGLAGVAWIPFNPQAEFVFTPEEGTKELYVQLADAAGNLTMEFPAPVTMVTRAEVAGRIRLEGSGAVEQVVVSLVGGGSQATPATDGSFLLGGVPLGLARIGFTMMGTDAARYVSAERVANVVPDVPVAVADVTLALARGTVTGHVRLAGESVHSLIAVSLSDVTDPGNTRGALTNEQGTYTLDFLPVGTYQLYAEKPGWARGNLGTQAVTAGAITAVPDATLVQSGGGDFIINDGQGFTNDPTLHLKLNHPTATQFLASENAALTGAAPRAFTNNVAVDFPLTSPADGPKVVYVRYVTAPPNTDTASATIVFDQTPPDHTQGSVQMDGNAPFSTSVLGKVRLDVNGVDNLSGVERVLISFNGVQAGALNRPFVPFYTGVDLPNPATDGQRTVSVWFVDRAGNTATQPVADVIYLDRTPPVGSSPGLTGETGASVRSSAVTVALAATDVCGTGYPAACSGGTINAWQVILGNRDDFAGSDWRPYSAQVAWFLEPGDGPRTLYVKFRDQAGNQSTRFQHQTTVDSTAPFGAAVTPVGGPLTRGINVDLILAAVGATRFRTGVTPAELQAAAFAAFPPGGTPSQLLQNTEGAQTIYAEFADDAGNSVVASAVVTLDSTAPPAPGPVLVSAKTTAAFLDWSDVAEPAPGSGVVGYVAEALQGSAVVATGTFSVSEGWLSGLPGYAELGFRVRAVDAAGNGSANSPVTTEVAGFAHAAVVPPGPDPVTPVVALGHLVSAIPENSNASTTTLLLCDLRGGDCRHSGLATAALADSGGYASAPAVSSDQGELFVFEYDDRTGGTHSLWAHVFGGTADDIRDTAGPAWQTAGPLGTFSAGNFGDTSQVSAASAASNGRVLVVAAFQDILANSGAHRLRVHVCEHADKCVVPGGWALVTPVTITVNSGVGSGDVGFQLLPGGRPSLDAGDANVWAAYPATGWVTWSSSNTYTAQGAQGVAVVGCLMGSGCGSAGNWSKVNLPLTSAGSVQVLDTGTRLVVLASGRLTTGEQGLLAWTCAFSGNGLFGTQCTSAAAFSGPVLLLPLGAVSMDVFGATQQYGRLHVAITDPDDSSVHYGTCVATSDCGAVSNWSFVATGRTGPELNAGGTLLAVADGNPVILASPNTRLLVTEPAISSPLGSAFLPRLIPAGVRAVFGGRDPALTDSVQAAFDQVGGATGQTSVTLDVFSGEIPLSGNDTLLHQGTLTAAAGRDLSVPLLTMEARSARSFAPSPDVVPDLPPAYVSTGTCHVVLYSEAWALKALACPSAADCTLAANWQSAVLEPARTPYPEIERVAATADSGNVYAIYVNAFVLD